MARLRDASNKVKLLSERNIEQALAIQAVKSQLSAAAAATAAAAAANSPPSQSAAAAAAAAAAGGLPLASPAMAQPDFDLAAAAGGNAAGISPGTAYTRQTYATAFDDGASLYTTATGPAGVQAAVAAAAAVAASAAAASAGGVPPYAMPYVPVDAAAVTLASPPPPRALMSAESPGELFDPEVMALFDKHRIAVRDLWAFYTAMSRGADGSRGTATGVDLKRFVGVMLDYDICPTFVTKRELKQIFAGASKAHGGASAAAVAAAAAGDEAASLPPLTYAAFVEALGRTALVALAKPAFMTLYPRAYDKVKVLLEMWGIADARKLRDVQDAIANAGGASGARGAPGSVAGKSRAASVATGTSGRKAGRSGAGSVRQ
jgi:hypothetical protein